MAKKIINIDPVIDRRVKEIMKDKVRRIDTIIATWVGVMVAITALSGTVIKYFSGESKNPTFEQQISKLNETEQSLKTLMQFVQDQQKKLKESQNVVADLKSQHEKLKPVVDADQKVVDAILDAQATRSNVHVWRERGIGFVLGTLSSMLAAGLIWAGAKAWNKLRTPPIQAVAESPEDTGGDAES
jgi:2C-methyl-D-erythritol 2,4-cyclodiphosphate synthase